MTVRPLCGRCYEPLDGDPCDVIALGRRYCSLRCALAETSGNYWYPPPRRRHSLRGFDGLTRVQRAMCRKWAQVLTLGRVYR